MPDPASVRPGHSHAPLLRKAVLAMAENEPVSGRAFCERVARWTRGKWRLGPGTIYPLLQAMEGEGLLTHRTAPSAGRGRRELVYTPTSKGRASLRRARSEGREAVREMILRVLPVAVFVNLGEEDLELMEAAPAFVLAAHERLWRAAELPRSRRVRAVERLRAATEGVRNP